MKEKLQSDIRFLRCVMRNFVHFSRTFSNLSADIVSCEGLASPVEEYWMSWRDAVLDLVCDASDQKSQLYAVIKRCINSLSLSVEGPRAVQLLTEIGRLLPTSTTLILKQLESSFPYWKNSQITPKHVGSYTENMLEVSQRLPQLRERILNFLTSKIVQLDNFIRIDNIQQIYQADAETGNIPTVVTTTTTTTSGSIRTLVRDKVISEEKQQEEEETSVAYQQSLTQMRDYAEKLDGMLSALFSYIDSSNNASGSGREVGLLLLLNFEKKILTHKSRYAQFLIYFASSYDAVISDRFLGLLLASLFAKDLQLSSSNNNNTNSLKVNTKQSAMALATTAAFIGSFVQRASSSFLSSDQINSTVELLLEWIGRKIEAIEHFSTSQLEIGILASVTQSLLIILKYSSLPLYEFIENDVRFKRAVGLSKNLISSDILGSFCSSHNVEAESDCFFITEKLDKFFPFDPLPFSQSSQIILDRKIFQQ